MSTPVGSLQVVPDIDDEKESEKDQSVPTKQSIPVKVPENEKKVVLSEVVHAPVVLCPSPHRLIGRRRQQQALHPPIRQMSSDAEPLTAAELQAHRQVFQHMS